MKKKTEDPDWFPHKGNNIQEINKTLIDSLAQCINYESQPILGFPGTTPNKLALQVHNMFSKRQPNNIGYHTKSADEKPSEMGFAGTQKLEREFIYGVAQMIGVKNPSKKIDGYLCTGGTDGNDHGLWLARNKLWKDITVTEGENQGIVVLRSFLFHYSIEKAFHRLLGKNPNESCKHSNMLLELPTDNNGELEPRVVEEEIRAHHKKGYRRFAVFLTAGTTNMGSIDPVYEICKTLERLRSELYMAAYVHVDAAFGGFVIPFIEPDCKFAFQHPLVGSVSIDAHKTGWVPYSAGIFLCRKGFLEFTKTTARYIYGHTDYTIPGSRSGAIAAACWATLQQHGYEGFNEIIQRCMKHRQYLEDALKTIPGIQIYKGRTNILTVRLSRNLKKRFSEIREQFCIVQDHFPKDLTERDEKTMIIKRTILVYRFTIMPHVTKKDIDDFISTLSN